MSQIDREALERVARVESALERIDAMADGAPREAALAAVSALVDLYGDGLARIVRHVSEQCDDRVEGRIAGAFVGDELIAHLLMLHGLHPEDTRWRVEGALESVRPYLQSHGGNVDLVTITGGTVRLRLQGHCKSCPSSTATLRTTVEDAILAAAPEVLRIETDDELTLGNDPAPLIPLVRARRDRHAAPAAAELVV
ncbi:MAG TPA: NifU family protein [Gemmatimonadaceae bacterium]|jgi:Fe-S cluster biogenesis protein NfuA